MNYKLLGQEINRLKTELALFKLDGLKDFKPCMDVVNFNKILDNLKSKNNLSQNADEFFKNIFSVDDYYSAISEHLKEIKTKLKDKMQKQGVDTQANANLRQSIKDISNIIDSLIIEYRNEEKRDKRRFLSAGENRKKIRYALSQFNQIHKQMSLILRLDSLIAADVVLMEFENFFSFIFYSIKAAKSKNDELMLIEIAGLIDQIMQIIEPVFSQKSLKASELVYHYLNYELRELKASATNGGL